MQLIAFSLPMMLGNIFQILYNTVDSVVVGNFVGTEALAAVGSTTIIVNIMVYFFNGFSTGATVVIARRFGAGDQQELHTAIHTIMAATFFLSVVATVAGVLVSIPCFALCPLQMMYLIKRQYICVSTWLVFRAWLFKTCAVGFYVR